jgi:hypothetical protein
MRLNVMGSLGLVMLTDGDPRPLVDDPVPGVTYRVTALADSRAGACSAPSGSPALSTCTTLRAAVIAANANTGQDAIVFDVNGAITLSVPGLDDDAQAGDLDVTDALTIIGNGVTNTIIQGGPGPGSGIDKVFSFNPLGLQPGFAVSISGLTIQFGTNTDTGLIDGDNEGGAFDFDASAVDGAGSLSVANCSILQNRTVNGDGGGIALFDGGTVTITGTLISGNVAGLQDPTEWYGFFGGGVYLTGGGYGYPATISISGSSISNNTASAPGQTPPAQIGGGVYSDFAGVAIQTTTISGNTASSDGGGLYGDGFVVGPGTVISGNVSGGNGGGLYGVSSVTGATLANNSAAGWGAALFAEGPGAAISASRIFGNVSQNAASVLDGDDTVGATIATADNWWGSNGSPANLVAADVATFSPWLVMTFAASPASIYSGGSSVLAAAINTGSDGSTGFAVPDGTPVTFSGTLGTVSSVSTASLAGSARSTYTAGSNAGTGSGSATIDNQTLSAPIVITVPPPPTLSLVSPASGVQGTTVPVTLTGTNFVAGSTVVVSNSGITVSGVTVVSATEITATFTIAPSAALGAANVSVTTGGGTSGTVSFTVTNAAFSRYRAITIDHTKVANTDQSNFPFLFSGTFSYLATVANGGEVTNASGYDISFYADAAGATPLRWEMESYDPASGTINAWILVPTLSHTANTTIYLFYGNAGITSFQGGALGSVWDANFQAVWHLPNGGVLTANDSTANGNNAAIVGASAAAGRIGGGAEFSSASDSITAPNSASLNITGAWTLSCWVYPTVSNAYQGLISRGGTSWDYAMYLIPSGTDYLYLVSDNFGMAINLMSHPWSVNAWNHIVVTVSQSGTATVYVNGQQAAVVPSAFSPSAVPLPQSDVATTTLGRNFIGTLDECRVSSSARSGDWIKTEFNNQNSPSTFYFIGAETSRF